MLVCHCKRVNHLEIERRIAEGATTLATLQAATGAGTCCGGCKPHLHALLAENTRLSGASEHAATLPGDRPLPLVRTGRPARVDVAAE